MAFALGALATTTSAKYALDWYEVSGGGGVSAGGQYSLSGTIGQHDAGNAMTGGNYSLTGGFWSLISASRARWDVAKTSLVLLRRVCRTLMRISRVLAPCSD